MFGFHEQNAIGKRGEALFLNMFPKWSANNLATKCKEPDFKDVHGRKLELKFDLSDIVYLLAISSKPTEQQKNVRKVSYPKFHALSIDTTCEFISLILLMV